MRKMASKVTLAIPFLFYNKEHSDHKGRMAISKYQQKYSAMYVQNTTDDKQKHIDSFYEHVCNGESLDQFFNSENLKEEMYTVGPLISLESKKVYDQPITLVTLSVLLAHQAAYINDGYDKYTQPEKLNGALIGGVLAGVVMPILLNQLGVSASSYVEIIVVGGAIGSLCSVNSEQKDLQELTRKYCENAQALTQRGARPETRNFGSSKSFDQAFRDLHPSIHLKENKDYPSFLARQIVNGNNEFQGLTGLSAINKQDHQHGCSRSILPQLKRILDTHSLYTCDKETLNRVSSSDPLPIPPEDISVGELPSYVNKQDAKSDGNENAKTIEDFIREGNVAQLPSRAFVKIPLEGEEDSYSLEPNPIKILCGKDEAVIRLTDKKDTRAFICPETNEQGFNPNNWKPIKEDEYQKDCEEFNYYCSFVGEYEEDYCRYPSVFSHYRQEKWGVN